MKEFSQQFRNLSMKFGSAVDPNCACSSCGDSFYRHEHTVDVCRECLRRRGIWEDAAVPKRYMDHPAPKQDVIDAAVETTDSLFVFGQTGKFKTTFACHYLRQLCMTHGLQPKLIRTTRFVLESQSSYRRDSGPSGYADSLYAVGALCFDDLGKEKWTPDVLNILFDVISEREEQGRLTVFTSNYSLDEIAEMIDRALARRIFDMCKLVEFS